MEIVSIIRLTLFLLTILPFFWYFFKNKSSVKELGMKEIANQLLIIALFTSPNTLYFILSLFFFTHWGALISWIFVIIFNGIVFMSVLKSKNSTATIGLLIIPIGNFIIFGLGVLFYSIAAKF